MTRRVYQLLRLAVDDQPNRDLAGMEAVSADAQDRAQAGNSGGAEQGGERL